MATVRDSDYQRCDYLRAVYRKAEASDFNYSTRLEKAENQVFQITVRAVVFSTYA